MCMGAFWCRAICFISWSVGDNRYIILNVFLVLWGGAIEHMLFIGILTILLFLEPLLLNVICVCMVVWVLFGCKCKKLLLICLAFP
jgi:hypothetical protein